jgi:hypothetical protein
MSEVSSKACKPRPNPYLNGAYKLLGKPQETAPHHLIIN